MRRIMVGLALAAASVNAGCTEESDTGASGAGAAGAGVTVGVGGGSEAGPLIGAVKRYDVAFDLATLEARTKLTVDVADPGGDCFDVACELVASEVTMDGALASSSVVEGGLLSACGQPRGAGKLTLEARTLVPETTALGLDVGFSRSKNLAGGTFSYLLSWVGGCDRFGPCDDHPSRLVELGFAVTHAAGDVVLCPGALVPGDTLTTCELSGTLAPTYSGFAVAADPDWIRTPFVKAGGTEMVFYEVPGGKLRTSLDPTSVSELMEWLTSELGPFPYGPELRVAGAPTAWFGFEHPANIILREDLPKYDGQAYANTTLHVLTHELVHQWSGDRTTLASEADFVWKEAIAEYLTYVFEDERRPAGEAAASLAYWDEIALDAQYHPRPTEQPTPPLTKFYGDVYGPGPMVLFVQLESLLGRATVLAAIRSFLAEPGARSVEELKAALAAEAKVSLDAYFEAWVFGSGKPEWPTFGVNAEQLGNEVSITVYDTGASEKLHGCVVEVDVLGATMKATALIDFGVSPTVATKTATITLTEPLVEVVLDPRHRLVSWNAANAVAERAAPRRKPIPF